MTLKTMIKANLADIFRMDRASRADTRLYMWRQRRSQKPSHLVKPRNMPTFELADDYVRRPASHRRRLSSTANMHSLAGLDNLSSYRKDTLAHDFAMSAELKTPAFEPE